MFLNNLQVRTGIERSILTLPWWDTRRHEPRRTFLRTTIEAPGTAIA